MTNFTKNFAITVAALALSAGAASAQQLKAEIPFAFQAGGKVMPAGTYRVNNVATNNGAVFALQGDKTSSVVLPGARHDANKSWSDKAPRLAFACGETCQLTEVYAGGDASAYSIPMGKN